MDGERLEGEVVLMDKDCKKKLDMEEHVSVPKRAYISRAARCLWCSSILRGTARKAHTKTCRMRKSEELRGTAKAEAAQRRVKEYQDKALERATKQTKSSPEETRTDTTATSTGSSSSSGAAPASNSSSGGDAVRTGSAGGDDEASRV